MDKLVIELAPAGWQVMAQVSLGEILRCEDKAAYSCINSKRVDLLVVDEECRPVGAVEYQGDGHYLGAHATAARDAVKKEALRRAGIGYEEILAGHHTPAELRRVVEKLVQRAGGRQISALCHRNLPHRNLPNRERPDLPACRVTIVAHGSMVPGA